MNTHSCYPSFRYQSVDLLVRRVDLRRCGAKELAGRALQVLRQLVARSSSRLLPLSLPNLTHCWKERAESLKLSALNKGTK